MHIENVEIKNDLIRFLETQGLKVWELDFIPLGEESYSWKISVDDQTLFLKFCSNKDNIKNIHFINNLLISLESDFIVPPHLINGKTELRFQNGYIYAYKFIEGSVVMLPNEELDKPLVDKLTNIMSQIHIANTLNIQIPTESFDYRFMRAYDEILRRIVSDQTKPIITTDKMDKLKGLIVEFEEASKKHHEANHEMVITHGDITGRNIMISTDGTIKLLDWDEAMLAPKERDINFLYDNPHFDLEKYRKKTDSEPLNQDLREYYGMVWSLESILENLSRLQNYQPEYGSKDELLEDALGYLDYY